MKNVYLGIFLLALFFAGCSSSRKLTDTKNPEQSQPYRTATKSDSLLGMLTKYRTCYDVYFEDLNISLNPEGKTIKGSEKIYASVTSDFDTLQVDLYKNLAIERILLNDTLQLNYYRVENSVFVIMPAKFSIGGKFFINVTYSGSPQPAVRAPWEGGFVWEKDKTGKPWVGVSCEGEGPAVWRPVKDHNYDEPDSVLVSITLREPLTGVSNGVLRETIANSDSTKTFRWFTSYPINNYNVTVYAGDYVLLQDTMLSISGNVLPISYYVLPYNVDHAKRQFVQVKPILRFFEDIFGEYPWQRDGYKLIDSPYQGMEHQSAIAYGSGFKDVFEGGWDHIILHETAHEWWGNSVTAFDLAEGWIHEGFATYSEVLYVEKYFPKYQKNYMFLLRSRIKNLRPVVGPEGRKFFYEPKVDSDIYMKGAWTLHSLRTYLKNDSLFFDILKSFITKFRQGIATSKDFIDMIEERSGDKIQWFFDQYLKNRYVPVLEIALTRDGLYYRWTHTNNNFQMPVKIKLGSDEVEIKPTVKIQFYQWNQPTLSINLQQSLFLVKENSALPHMFRK